MLIAITKSKYRYAKDLSNYAISLVTPFYPDQDIKQAFSITFPGFINPIDLSLISTPTYPQIPSIVSFYNGNHIPQSLKELDSRNHIKEKDKLPREFPIAKAKLTILDGRPQKDLNQNEI